MRYGTHSKAPPILHTSKEARYIGLKYYKLLFEGEIQGGIVKDVGNPKKPYIYVNWDHDILFPVPIFCFMLHVDSLVFPGNNLIKILLLLTPHLHRAQPQTWYDLELEILSSLGKLQRLKRIAIPEFNTHWNTDWVHMLIYADNLSEIIVYEPRHLQIYNRFEEFEHAYAAGIRFDIELVDVTDIDLSPSCYDTPILRICFRQLMMFRNIMAEDKLYWDLHSIQPIIKPMIVELQEVKR